MGGLKRSKKDSGLYYFYFMILNVISRFKSVCSFAEKKSKRKKKEEEEEYYEPDNLEEGENLQFFSLLT